MRVHLGASFGAVTQVRLSVCVNIALPVLRCVCVCLYSCIYKWKPAHLQTQGGECAFLQIRPCAHSRYSAGRVTGCDQGVKHLQ